MKRWAKTFVLCTAACALLARTAAGAPGDKGLAVAASETGKAYLTYGGEPLFAFGPGDELRTLSGAADVERWATWQRANGMNLIRAYPASVPVEVYGASGLHPFLRRDGKWDVDALNDEYFDYLGGVAATLEDHGIILHLQLWQIVFFKGGSNRWDANYLNPANNVNEWTQGLNRGRDYIDAPAGSPARAHQRMWVNRVLDAVKGRGNVIIDVINELGNEMGTLEWAVEVTRWIREWEAGNDASFIVGVDSEHHYVPDRFGPVREHFDVIILNELRSREHALEAIAAFNMPALSVRSSDGRNHWSDYLFARPDQTGPEHQTRYRTLCYRSLFAGLQSVGAYWKPLVDEADYRSMEAWPQYAKALRAFWEEIAPYWPRLTPDRDVTRIVSAVTPHASVLESPERILAYLECGSHTHNNSYPASMLALRCANEPSAVTHFDPRTGTAQSVPYTVADGMLKIDLPAFTDDAVVIVRFGD